MIGLLTQTPSNSFITNLNELSPYVGSVDTSTALETMSVILPLRNEAMVRYMAWIVCEGCMKLLYHYSLEIKNKG